ncbi:MAG: ABC transporter permease subunit [Dehalococcoidia bacterium]|nr:ABC transporter permease subunit [Dehalococcoidia bacterium]
MSALETKTTSVSALREASSAAPGRKRELLAQGIMVVAFVVLWEAVGRGDFVYGLIPTFSDTLVGVWSIVTSSTIGRQISISSYEIGAGLGVAIVAGVAVGLALGSVDYLRKVFEPLITYVAAFPKIVMFPVFLLLFGVGPESKLAMGAVSGFVPIVLNVLVAMRSIDDKYIKMARSLGTTRLQMYRKIYLPGMVYPIIAGIRLGTGLAIVGALLGEIKVSNGGLGWLAHFYLAQFSIPKMYAVLAIIFLGAVAINLVLSLILARFTRFKASELAEATPLM